MYLELNSFLSNQIVTVWWFIKIFYKFYIKIFISFFVINILYALVLICLNFYKRIIESKFGGEFYDVKLLLHNLKEFYLVYKFYFQKMLPNLWFYPLFVLLLPITISIRLVQVPFILIFVPYWFYKIIRVLLNFKKLNVNCIIQYKGFDFNKFIVNGWSSFFLTIFINDSKRISFNINYNLFKLFYKFTLFNKTNILSLILICVVYSILVTFVLVVGVPFIVIGKTIRLSFLILKRLGSPFFKNVPTFSQKIEIIFFQILEEFCEVWFHDILENGSTKRIIVKDNNIIFNPFGKGTIIPVSSIKIASKYPQFLEKAQIELGQPNLNSTVQTMLDSVDIAYSPINWGGGNVLGKHYIQLFKLNSGVLHFNLTSSMKTDSPQLLNLITSPNQFFQKPSYLTCGEFVPKKLEVGLDEVLNTLIPSRLEKVNFFKINQVSFESSDEKIFKKEFIIGILSSLESSIYMSGTDFEKKFHLDLGLLLTQEFSQLGINRPYVRDLRQLIESDFKNDINEFTLKFGPQFKDILVNELTNNTLLATLDTRLFYQKMNYFQNSFFTLKKDKVTYEAIKILKKSWGFDPLTTSDNTEDSFN